jgi:hypothetical protein
MNLEELVSLIQIRQYVVHAVNIASIDRATVTEMNNTLILLDKKIIELLKSPEFKEYIKYAEVRQAIENAARITNIKSGLKK